jgi:hypothetical protein
MVLAGTCSARMMMAIGQRRTACLENLDNATLTSAHKRVTMIVVRYAYPILLDIDGLDVLMLPCGVYVKRGLTMGGPGGSHR